MFSHLAGRFARAGDKFNTNAEIAAGKAGDIELASYQKATITLSDDLTCLVKAVNGGAKINPSISIRPIAKPAAQPGNQQRPNQYNGYGGDRAFGNANDNRQGYSGDRSQGNGNQNANGHSHGNGNGNGNGRGGGFGNGCNGRGGGYGNGCNMVPAANGWGNGW